MPMRLLAPLSLVVAVALAQALASPAHARPRASTRASTRAVPPPRVRLAASFSPELLGKGTNVSLAFRVLYPAGQAPLPVTEVRLLYPAGLGIGSSELGLQTCDPARLEAWGPRACPPNSLMGHGVAQVKVPFGPREVSETAPIAIYSQPVSENHIGLLFSVSGSFPVIANLAFGAFVLPAVPPYGGTIDTLLPLVPSVPGGADVALVGLRTTIGPKGILYSERVGGRVVRFHPGGVLLPRSCPRGGFPFAARLTFAGGGQARGAARVRCPR